MAICLKSRTRTNLLSHKPWFLPSFFSEGWFSMLPNQDHLAHKTSHYIVGDIALTTVGLRAFFSSCLRLTDEPMVMDSPTNIHDEKHEPKNIQELFKSWGYNNEETSHILECVPSLHKSKLSKLQSKLKILRDVGFTSSELVKIVSCRPHFLKCRINMDLVERMRYLEHLFGSKEILQNAILRNPCFLNYDLKKTIEPAVEMYKSMGVTGRDLSLMLVSRPTIIPRMSLSAEKLEYIRKTGVSKASKMYKYVVTIMAITRLETIREKIANIEKFGILEDEVLQLLGTSPLVLTLSVDKVQRNMTFVVTSMKQPAKVVLAHPFLLYKNLETCLKARMILAAKINDMGLGPIINGPKVFTALRMAEKRFVNVFISCHPIEIANELMKCYTDAKHVDQLAEKEKKIGFKGFPF